jgi:hypothetical protein
MLVVRHDEERPLQSIICGSNCRAHHPGHEDMKVVSYVTDFHIDWHNSLHS